MVTVGKSTDLTHEPEPTDAVVRHDRVTFEGFGAKVEVVSRNAVSRLGGPLAALLYMVVVVASFGVLTKVVRGVGASTSTALVFGAVGAAVALFVVVLVERYSRKAGKR
jgi:phosphate/sulfate permease